MGMTSELRRRAKFAALPLLAVACIAYFGYHAVEGDRGLVAWLRLGQEVQKIETRIEVNKAEIDRLERRVALLKPKALDRDMLDERARAVLGLAHPDEITIIVRPN